MKLNATQDWKPQEASGNGMIRSTSWILLTFFPPETSQSSIPHEWYIPVSGNTYVLRTWGRFVRTNHFILQGGSVKKLVEAGGKLPYRLILL